MTRRTRRILATAFAALLALPGAASAALPDLVSDPPANPRHEVSSTGADARLLLRFDAYVHNEEHAGPLEILATIQPDDPDTPGVDEGDTSPARSVTQVVEGEDDRAMAADTMIFEDTVAGAGGNEDGHNHWHLQRASDYSLVGTSSDAAVAPAQKVGFCLVDSQWTGGGTAPPERYDDPWSCMRTEWVQNDVRMGVSPGFRDIYGSNTMFQWVDVSHVQPGQYRLRSEVDPADVIDELDETNSPGYRDVVVRGYLPRERLVNRDAGSAPTSFGLASDAFKLTGPREPAFEDPEFKLVTPPRHGTISLGDWQPGSIVEYTPDDISNADDSFTYAVREKGSEFPRTASVATVRITVGEKPVIAIGPGPQEMIVGTSVDLTATPAAEYWDATAGLIDRRTGRFTAPAQVPPGGTVTVTAVSDVGAVDTRTIRIVERPPNEPAPEPPGMPRGDLVVPGPAPVVPRPPFALPRRAIERVKAARVGRYVAVTAVPGQSGRLTVSLRKGRKRIKGCVMNARAGASHTCRIKRPRGERSALRAVVVLRRRTGATVSRTASVPAVKRARASAHRH